MRYPFALGMLFLSLLLGACGGGGGGGGGGAAAETLDNPDIALLMVSGHQGVFDGRPSESYLHEDMGPALVADLEAAGYSVQVFYFVDNIDATDYPGFVGLVNLLTQIRDAWIFGAQVSTQVVVVSHSHGGVWATAAVRQVGDCPIAAHIALDHSSYAWGLVGHDTSAIGGDPQSALEIAAVANCATYPGVPSEQDRFYDLEDVVMPSVLAALEVRSGDAPIPGLEWFDERWNVRSDGTFDGLSCYYSDDTHSEVHEVTGSTYPVVLSWLLGRL